MYHRIIGAVAVLLIGASGVRAQDDSDSLGGLTDGTGQGPVGNVGLDGDSATLEALVERADRITVGEVGAMQRVIEDHVVHTEDGEPITGKFIFTYVDLAPSEHIVGEAVSTVTVRLLGGLHPDGTKVTTYAQAPSLASEEKVLLFLEEAPERGPNEALVHQIAFHRAGKFRVGGEGEDAPLVRDLPNSELGIDPTEGIGEDPIPLNRMKELIQAARTDD